MVEIEIPQVVERKPINQLKRVPFETPCKHLTPTVNPAFKKQMDCLDLTARKSTLSADGSVTIGTSCKRGGCSCSYESLVSNDSICVFHSGVPVFHEGYKFWSCCKKKTSDFSAFLSQIGCETGKHKWEQEGEHAKVNCRWDWHQTASNVVVAVYAKSYDYARSFVKVNPIRLVVKLIFPQQDDAEFCIDLELRGVIDVHKSSTTMYGTKIEITLPKAEGGHWSDLNFHRENIDEECQTEVSNGVKEQHKGNSTPVSQPKKEATPEYDETDSDIDLDDLELVQGATIQELGELARSCQLVEES